MNLARVSRAARAASTALEVGSAGLLLLGEVSTVYGAFNEADRTYDLQMRNHRGRFNASLMGAGTVGAGPAQHLAGEAIRGILDWAAN